MHMTPTNARGWVMLDFFKTQFDYDYWANDRILRAASGVTDVQFAAPGHCGWGGLRERTKSP